MSKHVLFLKPFLYVLVLALIAAPLSPVNARGVADPGGPGTEPGQPTVSTLPDGTSIFSFPARPDLPAQQPDLQDPNLVASGFGQPPESLAGTSGDDRENSSPTIWAVYTHLTTADVVSIATTNNYRVVDLYVETATVPYKFTAVFVANSGSYAKSWWFLAAVTPTDLLNFAVSNTARIVVQKAFNDPSPGGSVLFYSILISNTGTDAKTWWFYKDQTVADITALWQANNARLVQVNSYVRNSTTYYDIVMISNTGTDARSWWWYVNTTPAQLGTHLSNNGARMYDLDYDAATGNYNAIMTSCSGGCPAWWWYFGVSTSNLVNTAIQNGARIIDANVTPGCGDSCWDILLIDNTAKTISGNAGVGGATLSYTDGTSKVTTANSSGLYSFKVNSGWTGTITPSKTGYFFSPASINITTPVTADLPNQNFSAKRSTIVDFNGDGKTEVAIYRPGNAAWYINGMGTTYWGGVPGDIPALADYNGDGKTEIAIYRSNAAWYINGIGTTYWGGMPGDIPVPADYNGDGKSEIAIYRPSNGAWYINGVGTIYWGGVAGDIPIPADYNADGVADIAIYRPSNGAWYIRGLGTTYWGGVANDIPVPADYNGDGLVDIAIYRPGNAAWYINGVGTVYWGGVPGDIPVPGDYNGDGVTEIAIYRSNAAWYIRGVGTTYWGGVPGDFPLPARDTNGDGDPYQSQQ